MAHDHDDEDERIPLTVALPIATVRWLAKLSRITGDSPPDMIESMLHDIRVDDEAMHRNLH
jgi:hypothetical protein